MYSLWIHLIINYSNYNVTNKGYKSITKIINTNHYLKNIIKCYIF